MKTNFILLFLLFSGIVSIHAQSLVCINNVVGSLDQDGILTMSSDIVIESTSGQIDSIVVTPSEFTCDNLGSNTYQADAYFGGSIVTNCIGDIIIEDKLAPIAVGESMLTVTLDDNGEYHFTSEELDNGSYDNCGITSYSYSPVMVDCASPSPTTVTLTVTDQSNNSNQVLIDVYIDYNTTDNLTCNSSTVVNVIGGPVEINPEDVLEGNGPYTCMNLFYTECTDSDGNPISCTFDESHVGGSYVVEVINFATGSSCWGDVSVISQEQPYNICVEDFEGGSVKDVEIIMDVTTGDNGCTDISSGPGIKISPILNDDQLNGIDDIDLLLIREKILGVIPFKAEQLLAADVNNNGSVTTLDLVLIEKALLGEFNFEKSWIFMDSEYDFQDDVQPTNFDEFIILGNEPSYTFRGIKMGDVDLSYEQFVSNDDKVSLKAADIVLNKGEFYQVEVRLSELANLVVANVQFPAETAEYRVVNISSKVESYTFDPETDIANNIARFRWLGYEEAKTGGVQFDEDEALFTIEIEALENGILSQTFELEDVIGANKWKEAAVNNGASLKLEYTNLLTVPTIETAFVDMFISPNPAVQVIHLNHVYPNSQEVLSYVITDIMGKTVQKGILSDDQNISIAELNEGIYMIQLVNEGMYSTPKKFIKQL